MNRRTLELLPSAARFAVAAVLTICSVVASAQEEPAAQPPADQGTPPADQSTPPADQAAPAPEANTIPVQENAQAPAEKPAKSEPSATELEKIEVTGSRIKRSDYETESPVLVIKREDIEKTGLVSIGDVLQSLPQAGAALNRANNNGGNGETNVDLRNLGSNRVLVLVNGRRWVGATNSLNTSGVDLTTIPISVIDSIEVLKDGASAIYGSDAIAGVINIKTRRDFVGAELRSHVDVTQRGDGMQKLASFAAGNVSGKTSVFLNVEFVDQAALGAGSRPQSSVPRYGVTDPSRGSPFFIPNTRTIFVPTSNNGTAINAAAGDPTITGPCHDITGAVQPTPFPVPVAGALSLCDITLNPATFTGPNGPHDFIRYDLNRDAYNYAPVNYLITPNQHTSIYSQLSHQLTDKVRLSGEVLYNTRRSSQRLAQTPDGLGDLLGVHPFDYGYVASDNPYNPTNPQSPYYIPGTNAQDIGKGDQASGLVGLGAVLKRFVETGPRLFTETVNTYRTGGGLDGNFDLLNRYWSWDGGATYTETGRNDTDEGLINNEHLARASGPLNDCVATTDPNTGDIIPAPPIAAGCVPFDWFGGVGSVTPDMLNYVKYTGVNFFRSRESVYYVNGSTEIGELARWLAGPLGIAAGGEVRKEAYLGRPDPLQVNGTSSTNAQTGTQGQYTANEVYTEIRIPAFANVTWDSIGLGKGWLKGRSLVKELEVSLAGRYSRYTGFGDNLSGKAGLRFKPYDDLILRTTYSSAFRAPSITELYLGQLTSFPTVVDPCANDSGTTQGDVNAQQNCAADGASTTQSASQISTVFGGNPNLKPETAHTLSAGFVYSPAFIPDFNIAIDWYKIQLKKAISTLGPQLILDLCYRASPADRAYCENVQRDSSGNLSKINDVFLNFASLNVSGVDFNFDWTLPLPKFMQNYGSFKWVLDGAYVAQYDTVSPTPTGESTVGAVGYEFGGLGAIPRWKAKTGLTWNLQNWEASWNLRYIHHVIEPCDDGLAQPNGPTGEVLENPTPVKSLTQYGMCSDPSNKVLGPANVLADTYYNDVQAVYSVPNWNTKLTLGVDNVFNQNPPRSSSAFANSYDTNTYLPWDSRAPYAAIQINF